MKNLNLFSLLLILFSFLYAFGMGIKALEEQEGQIMAEIVIAEAAISKLSSAQQYSAKCENYIPDNGCDKFILSNNEYRKLKRSEMDQLYKNKKSGAILNNPFSASIPKITIKRNK